MTDEKRNQYGIEPDETPGIPGSPPASGSQPGAVPARKPEIERSPGVEPLPVESAQRPRRIGEELETPPSQRSVHELDVCPNCGASMTGPDALVCVRCGFDLKSMKKVQTVTGEVAAPAPGEDEEARLPLVQKGMGDLWLPVGMAAVSGLILLVGYLAGAAGLYPELRAAATEANRAIDVSLSHRFIGVFQFTVLVAMATACGLGALAFLSHLLGMKLVKDLEDLKLAALRVLAIVATMRLAAFIGVAYPAIERVVEAALQLGIFIGLSMLLFKLKPRDAVTLAVAATVLFLALWLSANAVVWATT